MSGRTTRPVARIAPADRRFPPDVMDVVAHSDGRLVSVTVARVREVLGDEVATTLERMARAVEAGSVTPTAADLEKQTKAWKSIGKTQCLIR